VLAIDGNLSDHRLHQPLSGSFRYLWAFPNTAIGLLFAAIVLLTRGRAQVVDGVLEVYGGAADSALASLPIGGGAAAITFGHVVLARDRTLLCLTRRHERVHVRQYERWGPLFMPAYLLAGAWAFATGAGAYEGNYFERDAVRRG
jgi:hypothetical protein